MKQVTIWQKGLFFLLSTTFSLSLYSQQSSVLQYLRPEIGGVGHLLVPTRPTIQLPNQMVRMTPDRRDYLDDQINSFPLLLVSHRIGQVFSIKPSSDASLSADSWGEKLAYDQDLEIRDPWHYSNFFTEKEINVDFVPGKKAAIFRFRFPKNSPKALLMGTYGNGHNYWRFSQGNTLQGMQYFNAEDGLRDVPVYVYGKFNMSGQFGGVKDNALVQGDSIAGDRVRAYIQFAPTQGDIVELRYAVSYISEEQAKKNFEEELPVSLTLENLAAKGKQEWTNVLGQIEVEGGTDAQKRSFYTALYRCYERMVNITEDGKYYSGYDNRIHTDSRPFYVDDWSWDTYLALHPLRTILQPKREEDMLQSYVRMYQQSGWVPTFPVLYGDHACMNGFHSSISMLDAYRKGLHDFDVEKAYEGMKKNSLEATLLPWRNGPATPLDKFYYKNGFFPALHPGEKEPYSEVHGFEKRQAVAVTLGASYDDWAVGQMAADLRKFSDTALFARRALNYRNLWNNERQFFLPKDSLGNWIQIDPAWDGGAGGRDYYDENNGWTYMWQVQHNIPDLVRLMGGRKAFENRLDQLFREDLGREKKLFWVKFTDATGLVGQFSMGNEPSFHIPYLYNFTDSPWKTQQRIRVLLHTWFHDDIFGIPGDEDGGGMSAFVVFSSMGFYPLTPGKPVYTIGSPVFSKVSVHLPNGKTFTVKADGCSERNKYIQSARLNGKTLTTPWFTHQQLINGGILELTMGERPNKNWGLGK